MDKPNVILITTDQHRGDCLGVDGNPYIQTPHLDQLAYTGVRFTQAFSECPVCVPARRTLMTGQHGYSHGMHSNRSHPYPSDTLFLAEAFRQKGYQTQAVGKMHTHPQRFRCGFEHVLLNEEGRRIGGLEYDDYEMFIFHFKRRRGRGRLGGVNNFCHAVYQVLINSFLRLLHR